MAGARPDERGVASDQQLGLGPLPGAETGDLVILLLACTLASLRDQLSIQGYDPEARVVADLVEITNDYLDRLSRVGRGNSAH